MLLTNNELKKIKSLNSRKGRREHKLFMAEGIRLLEETVRHRNRPNKLLFCKASISERGLTLVGRLKRSNVSICEISLRQMTAISQTKQAQGLVGIFDLKELDLPELYRGESRKILLCENISDPGNAGTLLRSALAFGFDMVILTGSAADPYSPKVVRASSGAIFGLELVVADFENIRNFIKANGIHLVASDLSGRKAGSKNEKKWKNRTIALAIGSEADGLSKEVLDIAETTIRIQHSERVESLNAGVAGSILMKQFYDLSIK